MRLLESAIETLTGLQTLSVRGCVSRVNGLAVSVSHLPAPVGASVLIHSDINGQTIKGEVVGFRGDDSSVMLLGSTAGVRPGDAVEVIKAEQTVGIGEAMRGRVVNAMGQPIDGGVAIAATHHRLIEAAVPDAMTRPLIDQPLGTGVRAIDAMLSVGKGQRLGVFSAPGVGKSTLLGMMARQTAADVIVVGLIGERGREVRDFCEQILGADDLNRSVVVAATGDESPLMRIRAAQLATTVAEYFRDQGQDVLLIMDSITRFCQAQRQVGLACGEMPATRGYPPSVFAALPRLLERSGRTERGSITGFYSILVEGDDMDEPISDACRGILDGHILLSRDLAEHGHYPAIDPLGSISRIVNDITDSAQQQAVRLVRSLLADYRKVEDLLVIGAYATGSNPAYDLAIQCKPMIDQLLQQGRTSTHSQTGDVFENTRQQLLTLAAEVRKLQEQIGRHRKQTSNRLSGDNRHSA